VHNIRCCVSALVKQFPDKTSTGSGTFAAISVHIILFKASAKNMCTNIENKIKNKLHGPMHYKIGVTCVFNRHEVYSLLQ